MRGRGGEDRVRKIRSGWQPPSHSFWVPALGSPPQRFLNDLACGPAHSHAPNLLASDQAAVDSLPECLTDESPLD
jgi:hypothetical protein